MDPCKRIRIHKRIKGIKKLLFLCWKALKEVFCRMNLQHLSNVLSVSKASLFKDASPFKLPPTKAASLSLTAIISPPLGFINTWVPIDRFASLFLSISHSNPYFGSVFFLFWWIYYHKFSQIHTWMSLLMRPHYHFRQSRRGFYLLFVETRCYKENGRSEQRRGSVTLNEAWWCSLHQLSVLRVEPRCGGFNARRGRLLRAHSVSMQVTALDAKMWRKQKASSDPGHKTQVELTLNKPANSLSQLKAILVQGHFYKVTKLSIRSHEGVTGMPGVQNTTARLQRISATQYSIAIADVNHMRHLKDFTLPQMADRWRRRSMRSVTGLRSESLEKGTPARVSLFSHRWRHFTLYHLLIAESHIKSSKEVRESACCESLLYIWVKCRKCHFEKT